MSLQILDFEIAQRLQFLGYAKDQPVIQNVADYVNHWELKDQLLVTYSKERGLDEIAHYLNRKRKTLLDQLGEDVKKSFLDIICSHFLQSKRDIGINEDGSIVETGEVKSIQEDALRVEYDTEGSTSSKATSKSPLDLMIDYLKQEAYLSLQSYRYMYPYHRWITYNDPDHTEPEDNP